MQLAYNVSYWRVKTVIGHSECSPPSCNIDAAKNEQKSSRIVCQKLISDKGERPLSYQEKWHKDISSTNETGI